MMRRIHLLTALVLSWSSLLLGQYHRPILTVGETTVPRIIYSPAPEYSDQARKAKREGTCTLTLVVGADGHTSAVRVISGLGMGLDEKAIEAVKKWTFEPATRKGKPVPVEIAAEIDFDCQNTCSATVRRSNAN